MSDPKIVEELRFIATEMIDDIDGGEECVGRDTRLTYWAEQVGKAAYIIQKQDEAIKTAQLNIAKIIAEMQK